MREAAIRSLVSYVSVFFWSGFEWKEAEQCVEEQEESLKGAEGKSWDNNGSIVLLT